MPRKKKTHCKHGHARIPDNVNSVRSCITCTRERARNWSANNPEKVSEKNRKQRDKNPELYRAIHIANKYDLDKEVVYQYLLERKDISVCDICQQECSTGKSLSVDHNHETGEIRGLLCKKCNSGLGMFNDSIKFMEVAIEYLKGSKV